MIRGFDGGASVGAAGADATGAGVGADAAGRVGAEAGGRGPGATASEAGAAGGRVVEVGAWAGGVAAGAVGEAAAGATAVTATGAGAAGSGVATTGGASATGAGAVGVATAPLEVATAPLVAAPLVTALDGAALDGAATSGAGDADSTAAASADAFFLPLTTTGSSGWTSRIRPSRSARRRARSAWASSMPDEWLFTPMPKTAARSSISLLVSPSSRASSCTRIFAAKWGSVLVYVRGAGWATRG